MSDVSVLEHDGMLRKLRKIRRVAWSDRVGPLLIGQEHDKIWFARHGAISP